MAKKMVKIYRYIQNKKRVFEKRAREEQEQEEEERNTKDQEVKKETLELRVERGVGQKAEGGQGGVLERGWGCGSAVQ